MKRPLVGILTTACLATHGFTDNPGIFAASAVVAGNGSISIDKPLLKLSPVVMAHNWNTMEAHAKKDASGGESGFRISIDQSNSLDGYLKASIGDDGSFNADFAFTSDAELEVNTVCLTTSFDSGLLGGGVWNADEASGAFPMEKAEKPSIFSGVVTRLAITWPDHSVEDVEFYFPSPTRILLQDNREWNSNSFTLRISPEYTNPLKRSDSFKLKFKVKLQSPMSLVIDKPVTITAGEEWIPIKHNLEIEPGSALDFSSIREWHAPAGKYGRLVATTNGAFEFAEMPGVEQRFYGNNLCFSANYVSAEEAEILASRFRRIGYNAVRIHHYDNILIEGSPDKTTLNRERLDQLDRLVAAFIKNGVYVKTDLFVSRAVPWRVIGIDRDGDIPMNEFKLLCAVEPRALGNWKEFTRQLMQHQNPYTGHTYAGEPGFAWVSFINEGNLGNFVEAQTKLPQVDVKWKEWLQRKRAEDAAYNDIPDTVPVNIYADNPHNSAYLQFLSYLEAEMYSAMKDFLRNELGCDALFTNANGWSHRLSDQVARKDMYDFVDDHFYVDHPRFIEKPWRLPSQFPNENPFKNSEMGMRPNAFLRLEGMPFTISEFNYSGPGRYRGVGGIVTGTIGALQDWDALWRFTYSHDREHMFSPTQMGYFDVANDPLMLATERASICIFLRGDAEPLAKTVTINVPREISTQFTAVLPRPAPGWLDVGWKAKVQMSVDAPDAAPNELVLPKAKAYGANGAAAARAFVANTQFGGGAVQVDGKSGKFSINTPRTAGVFSEGGTADAGLLSVDIMQAPATVWVSSLDGKPCSKSDRMLLTHLTDVQNTNIKYGEYARRTLLDWGGIPHLAQRGIARVELAVENPDEMSVYALDTAGRRTKKLECDTAAGRLIFTADTAAVPGDATLSYGLIREK